MENENHLSKLLNQFDLSANRFCEETNGSFCDIRNEYKGKESAGEVKYRSATVVYSSFVVEFRYTAHGILSVVNSILECCIHLDKTGAFPGVHLSFIAAYYGMETVAPLTIGLITNETGMEQAFVCIGGVLKEMLGRITATASDAEKKQALFQAYQAEIYEILNISESPEDVQESDSTLRTFADQSYDVFMTTRYTSAAFVNLISGKTAMAISKLGKIKQPTAYERHVLSLLQSGVCTHPYDLSEIEKNTAYYNNSGVPKANFKESTAFFLSAFIITIPVSAVLLAIYFLLYLLEGAGSVYLMGPIYNFPNCFLCAFIVSLSLSYFTRLKVYKRLYPKDYDRYAEMDAAQNGTKADRLMKRFTVLLVVASLVMIVLFTKWNINFREDGFVDNTRFLSVRGVFHSYDDIECLYSKNDRVNSLGEPLDFPSYVMRLKDGSEIDFYEFDDISAYEDDLPGYLQSIGIEIKHSQE